MMNYLVSITVHDIDGRQLDAWDGEEIVANSMEEVIKAAASWEANLEELNDSTDIKIEDDRVYYTNRDGLRLYKQIHVNLIED